MIRAYDELYLADAQKMLAAGFDYALTDCAFSPDWFAKVFARSRLSREYERGNPAILSGMAGEEFIKMIFQSVMPDQSFPTASFSEERTPAYWAGWALSYYQWYTAKRFKDIFLRIPLSEILAMYHLFHEMDLTNFIEAMDGRYNAVVLETKLKTIREARGLTQQELAEQSGVKKRSIQLYEQKVNDIDKAQVKTIYKLSRVLGCNIEDLLEQPEVDEITSPYCERK